jgi:BMFP domain-containing protein YqiC
MNKTLTIKIDKKFIEDCVYQEDWGEIKLDESELKENIAKYIKDSAETIVREVLREVVAEIAGKELRKEVKEKVRSFLIGMADTELFYRDEFRKLLVDIARENKKEIDKKVKAFLESNKMDGELISAIGHDMNSRFFDGIVNGKIE